MRSLYHELVEALLKDHPPSGMAPGPPRLSATTNQQSAISNEQSSMNNESCPTNHDPGIMSNSANQPD
jgi:hypothetical protein